MSFGKRDFSESGFVSLDTDKTLPCEVGLVEVEDEVDSFELDVFVVSTHELLPPAISFWLGDCPVSSSSFSSSFLFFGNNASKTSCFILDFTESEECNFLLGAVLLVEGREVDVLEVLPDETAMALFTSVELL